MSDLPPDLATHVASRSTDAQEADNAALPIGDRITYSLRQAAFLGVALLVAGLVTERLRPLEGSDRGITSTPFLWAIVVWLVVLLFHAIAFQQSEMRSLEGAPLFGALGFAAVLFLIGLISYDGGSFGRRVIYLFANALGAVMFWWGLLSLGYLVVRRLRD